LGAKPKPLAIDAKPCDQDAEIIVVALSGYLDTHTVLDFDREMNQRLEEGFVRFIIDAGDLNYISSAGIGSLMRFVQEVRQRGGGLVLLHPPERVYAVLDLLGFALIFKFASSIEQAVSFLREEA